ncbi:MAG: hypothetical protein LQ351_004832 [Letrouitia transgressa]|nr:MAG: hypothetical protein LQ351_004832 [Letrouitia transgressa]
MNSFATRRKAVKVGQDEEDDADAQYERLSTNETGKSLVRRLSEAFSWVFSKLRLTASTEPTSADVRPSFTPRGSFKSKKRPSARVSFGLSGTSMTQDDEEPTTVFTPKKSNLSRQAMEKNALRRSMATPLSAEQLQSRQAKEERPNYSAEYLSELKNSTPLTPKNLKPLSDAEVEKSKELDLAAKFGSDLSVYDIPTIPTDAEIREKKARRSRLAKEEEYITLEGSDESADDRRPRKEKLQSRVFEDDEDIAEGFDEFVEDGRIALGKKAERELKRKQKDEMRNMINEAEGNSSDESTDDSEAERRAAYEFTQTRAGMDGLQKGLHDQAERPRTPPKITPLPTLNGCLEKLEASLSKMKYERMQKMKRIEEIRKERAEIAKREVEIQKLLKEAGERYEKLRETTGGEFAASTNAQVLTENGAHGIDRGLESIGSTPITGMEVQKP